MLGRAWLALRAAAMRAWWAVARLRTRRTHATAPLGSPTARRRSWLQVSMEQNMGCAVGACLAAWLVVSMARSVCREGPVFAADEIRWEGWGA
jgi:hypothetical protein